MLKWLKNIWRAQNNASALEASQGEVVMLARALREVTKRLLDTRIQHERKLAEMQRTIDTLRGPGTPT